MTPITERPILFSAPMVRAILEGRKTQTRRLVKPVRGFEHHHICKPEMMAAPHEVWWHGDETDRVGCAQSCPYGNPDTRLYVRESWRALQMWDTFKPSELPNYAPICYDADDSIVGLTDEFSGEVFGKGRPSIFLPRWASRITLEITDVRVERLNYISEEDAEAEGVEPNPWADVLPDGEVSDAASKFRAGFHELWSRINGEGTWAANPWVWVLGFKVLGGGANGK